VSIKKNTNKPEKSKSGSGSTQNNSINEFGKNASKAGAAMEKSIKDMGKQAGDQIEKAEHATESKNKSQSGKGSKVNKTK
jgi:hypothetical protein